MTRWNVFRIKDRDRLGAVLQIKERMKAKGEHREVKLPLAITSVYPNKLMSIKLNLKTIRYHEKN